MRLNQWREEERLEEEDRQRRGERTELERREGIKRKEERSEEEAIKARGAERRAGAAGGNMVELYSEEEAGWEKVDIWRCIR